jgi:hypothetical protein
MQALLAADPNEAFVSASVAIGTRHARVLLFFTGGVD